MQQPGHQRQPQGGAEPVEVGDYVLLHTGYAINVIDEQRAKETLELFEEIARLDEIH